MQGLSVFKCVLLFFAVWSFVPTNTSSHGFVDPAYNNSTFFITAEGKLFGWGQTTYDLW